MKEKFQKPLEGARLCLTLNPDFWPPEIWGNKFLLFKAIIFVMMCYSSPKNYYIWGIIIIDFLEYLHFLDKYYLDIFYNSFYMLLFSFLVFFLIIYVYIHEIYSFLKLYLSDFGIRIIVASWNKLRNVPFPSTAWKNLWSISVNYSLYVWHNSPIKSSANFICGYFSPCTVCLSRNVLIPSKLSNSLALDCS